MYSAQVHEKNYKNKAKFYKQKRNLISRKFRQNIISQILRLHFVSISRKTIKIRRISQKMCHFKKNSSKHRVYANSTILRRFHEKICKKQRNFTTENQFHEKFVKTSFVRKFNHIATISRKKIYENQTNFTTENQFHEKIRQNVAHFSNPKKCVSAPDAVAAMVKCDNCHDKIVSDELTS